MYTKPTIEIIEVENEGVMALSDISNPGINTRSNAGNSRAGNLQNNSSRQELEDLINDLLTH